MEIPSKVSQNCTYVKNLGKMYLSCSFIGLCIGNKEGYRSDTGVIIQYILIYCNAVSKAICWKLKI